MWFLIPSFLNKGNCPESWDPIKTVPQPTFKKHLLRPTKTSQLTSFWFFGDLKLYWSKKIMIVQDTAWYRSLCSMFLRSSPWCQVSQEGTADSDGSTSSSFLFSFRHPGVLRSDLIGQPEMGGVFQDARRSDGSHPVGLLQPSEHRSDLRHAAEPQHQHRGKFHAMWPAFLQQWA